MSEPTKDQCYAEAVKEISQLTIELDKLRCAYANVCDNAARTENERDQLAAQLKELQGHIRCIYCNEKYTAEEKDKLADHIMTCEKSPLAQHLKEMDSRIIDRMDMVNDEFQRILAITDNQEIIGICERAQQVIEQKEPVIKQRDDAVKKKKELEDLHSHALLRIAKLVSREKVLVEALWDAHRSLNASENDELWRIAERSVKQALEACKI